MHQQREIYWLVSQPVKMPATGRAVAAENSRTRILDEAERIFAEFGYEGASLQVIAEAAGLARSTPAYFFNSKRHLYDAVLERLMSDAVDQLATVQSPAEIAVDIERRLETRTRAFLEFLIGRPAFMKLVQREALGSGGALQNSSAHLGAVQAGLAAMAGELTGQLGQANADDLRHLLVSFISLCWFPLATGPLLADFGLDVGDSDFVAQRARHVTRLLLHGTGGLR